MGFGPRISEASKTTSVVGGYLVFVGLISYYFKETLHISDAVPSTIFGVIFGSQCANLVNPSAWFGNDPHTLINFTLHFSRVIIGLQVFFSGASLPKRFIKTEWFSLLVVLLPIMAIGWLLTGLLIWALIPNLSYLESLVIAGCIVPTDPVMANTICKGRFAERFVPLNVRAFIVAESGANDGLALPYLMLPLYLVRRSDSQNAWSSIGVAIGHWIYEVIVYQVMMGAFMGILIGYSARKVLRWAHDKHLIDHESFLAYGIATSLFILGVVHTSGASAIIACFLAGCVINWDGWYQEECAGQAFGEIVDMYLATIIFIYIGAILPFDSWRADTNVLDGWRLFVLGLSVLLLRRLPVMIPLIRLMPCLDGWKEAAFVGYFGPVGVGTLYWTSEALEYLRDIPGRQNLREVILPINYFVIFFSVLVHGTSIFLFQGTQSAFGKGHPGQKDGHISPCNLRSRDGSSLSHGTTRRKSARDYLSSHMTIPSGSQHRPNAYRSQFDLAMERALSRRTSAHDYSNRSRAIGPEDYDWASHHHASHGNASKAKGKNLSFRRANSWPTSNRRRASNADSDAFSLQSITQPVSESPDRYRANSKTLRSDYANESSRLKRIRQSRLVPDEPVSDDDAADHSVSIKASQRSGDAFNRV